MAGETFLKGKVKIISMWDGAAYRPVACDTQNSLETTLEDGAVVVTKCDPDNVATSPGAFSYEMNGEGIQIDTTSVGAEITKASHDWLLTKQQAKELMNWRRATGLTDNPYYYGTGYIQNLSDDGEVAEDNPNATFSFTIQGTGGITTVDPGLV